MRIAIVNDTRIALEGLKRVIASAPEHEIIWLAHDGVEAVKCCNADTPDLILMDLIMPNMDGVEATRQIMTQCPCAILVVTSTVSGNTPQVFEAMGAGALDAVNTPVIGADNMAEGSLTLLQKINTISKLICAEGPSSTAPIQTPKGQTKTNHMLIAIGSSTGGPRALAQILGNLPANLPASIVIIQHVDQQFSQSFIDWLNEQTPLTVRMAQHNTTPQPGTVLVSDSNKHLTINAQGKLIYVDEPRDYPYRPSVNVFFSSMAKYWMGNAIGILLTGMGKDGANGLLDMRTRGFATIAQNQVSCAVYGMPKAAVHLNAADSILHINKIAPQIAEWVSSKQHSTMAGHT